MILGVRTLYPEGNTVKTYSIKLRVLPVRIDLEVAMGVFFDRIASIMFYDFLDPNT